jgi:hypothetical protein
MTLCYGPGTDCGHSDDDAHAAYGAAQLWLHILIPTGEVPSRETKVVVASTKQRIRTASAVRSQRKGDQGDHAVSTKGRSGD